MPPVSVQIRQFSPITQAAFLQNLGLEDKNRNGVIDRSAGEGYEEFIARYGNADIGFFINGITQGANNGKLEENEIINYYYSIIRFKELAETEAVEKDVNAYIYANNIPLVWQDDEQGTVVNAVSRILGKGWQDKKVSEDEAARMFRQVTNALGIKGVSGTPNNTGYYQLPEFIRRKAGYCFEVAQFGFWFFSQLEIDSLAVNAALTPTLIHQVIKVNNMNIDYFNISNSYGVHANQWAIFNPIQSISEYYAAQAKAKRNESEAEQAVIYNKYDISNICQLIELQITNPRRNHTEIIALGEFILQNVDISKIMRSDYKTLNFIKGNLEFILSALIESYNATRNRQGFNRVEQLLDQYYSADPKVKPFLDYYRF